MEAPVPVNLVLYERLDQLLKRQLILQLLTIVCGAYD